MADIESNIRIDIDTSGALSALKVLQSKISAFHTAMQQSGNAANAAISDGMQRNLINSINATKQFSASLTTVKSSSESFTTALEKNKLSMGEYFRYAAGSTKTFGKLFTNEFNTIEKVARERVKTLQTQYIKMGRDANGAIQAIKVRPLMLDMEKLGTQVQMAAQKQQIFNQLVKQGSTNLLNFGKNTQWAGRQLMVGFTIPLTMMGTAAVKSFMEMEKAVLKFQRVYGDLATTAADTEAMVNSIKGLANEFTKYGIAVADTMALAADAAAMGKTGADLTAQVAEATRLAVLGGVEQAQALETTTSLTNAFGIAAEDLAGKIDFLNSVENQTVTSIEDLTIAIPKAAPVIKQLGGNVEDLAFFLTAMKEGGINASEGANALKSGLASMINPTGKAAEFLASFGINVKNIVDSNAGDVKGIILDMAYALDKLDPLNRAQAIEQLFGKFQFARMTTLFQNVIAEGSQASRVLDMTKASAQELAILSERELKKVEDSPMFKFQKALEDIKTSLIPLGEEFLKLITPLVEFGGNMLKQFNNLDAGVKQFVMGAIGVLGLIAPAAIMTFGLFANGIANIIKGVGTVNKLFYKLAGATTDAAGPMGYFTQEQLEAASVAASLEQAHANLTQQFTSETTAILQLRDAYNQAIQAMSQYNAAAVINRTSPNAPGGKPKKYNSGVVMVPGTGNSDTVPAMLTPGEAIIPADVAKKNRGFISAMIKGKIPGFNGGTSGLGLKVSQADAQLIQSEASRFGALGAQEQAVAEQALRALSQEKRQSIKTWRRLLGFIASTEIEDETISRALGKAIDYGEAPEAKKKKKKEISAFRGVPVSTGIESEAKTAGRTEEFKVSKGISEAAYMSLVSQGYSPDDAAQVTGFKPGTNFTGVARGHNRDVGSAKAIAEGWQQPFINLDSRMENTILSSMTTHDKQGKTAVFEAYEKAANVLIGQNQEFRSEWEGLKAAIDKDVSFNEAQRKTFAKINAAVAGGGFGDQAITGRAKALGAGYDAVNIQNISGYQKKFTPAEIKSAEKNLVQRSSQILGISDKDLMQSGKDLVRGLVMGVEIEGEIKSPSRKMFQRGVDLVKGFIAGVKDKLDEAMQAGDQIGDAVVNGARPDGSIGGARTQTGSRIKADLDAALAVDEGGNFILDRKGRPLTQKQYDRQLRMQASAQKRGRRAGRAAGIFGTATMITGMVSGVGGPIGDIAGALTPFLGGLSAVAPLLMALPAPIALVVAGLGLIGFGLYKMNEQLTNARNEAMAMAKTFSSGREAMQGLAEFAGTVNPSETMDKIRAERRAEYQIVSGKNTFGAKYLESETGKNLVDEARKAKIDQGATAAAKNLGVQLAQAVSSNILTKEQAASIAANMGDALGDYDFAIDVNGTLVKLLGPGGEDLTKDPLKVKAEIIRTRQSATEGRGNAEDILLGTEKMFGLLVDARANSTEAAAAEALKAQQISDVISMGQQNLDQLELEHIKRLEILEAAGDINKINEENAKYESDRAFLLTTNVDAIKKEYDFINKLQFKGTSMQKSSARQIVDNLEKSYNDLFANADQQTKDIAKKTAENIANNPELSYAEKATITATMNVENLDLFKQVQALFPVGDNIPLWKAIAQVTVELGPGSQEDVLALLPGFKDKKTAQQFTEYVVKVKTTATNPADGAAQATAAIETMTALSKIKDEITGEPLNLDQYIDPKGNVTEKFKNISKKLKEVNDAFAKAKGKKITYTIFTQVTGLSLSKQAQQYFDSLPAAQQKVYTQTYLTIYDSIDLKTDEGKARIKAWRKQQAAAGSTLGNWAAGLTDLQVAQNIAEAGAFQRTQESKGVGTPTTPITPKTTGGGGNKTDPFENLLTRLKRVRDAAINAQGGLTELLRIAGKGKDIKIFQGIDQQLMKQGHSTEFIDDMMALDAAARKAYMTINKAGQVVVTAAGKAYQKGLQEAALGDYQLSLQKTTNELGYQITAMSKLEEAGLSTAEAMEISSNANLAYAISTNASSEEIKNFIKWLGELKKKQTELDFSTEAGREKAVSSAVSKAMEYFAAIEKQIDEDFEQGTNKSGKNTKNLNIGNLRSDIQAAQVQIEDYQYQIDDLQYLLDGIQEKEDEINEKYDKRAEALDKIWNINKDIAAQQKGQLDIAQALSSGDINAAARAVQEERARRVQESQQIQKDALENARKKELAAVTSTDGKTRTQIEKEIRDLNKEIAKIEEEKLEPLTRNLGIAERTRDAVKDLVGKEGYLGLTKTEWGNVETAARLATVQAESFAKVIRDTLKMIPGFAELFDEEGNFAGFKFDPSKYTEWLKGGSSQGDGGTDDGGSDDYVDPNAGNTGGSKNTGASSGAKTSGTSSSTTTTTTTKTSTDLTPSTVAALVAKTQDPKTAVAASTTLAKAAGVVIGKTTADTASKKISTYVNKKLGNNTVGVPKGTTLRALMGKSEGGLIPKYLADGGLAFNAIGTDTVPAMLTPGEFVVTRHAVKNFGVDRLKAINNGASINDSVYNYEVNVNVKSDANPDQIARAVVGQIRQADSQRIRSNIL